DRTGWWNLYAVRQGRIEAVHAADAEFGRPLWQLGAAKWAPIDETHLAVTFARNGRWSLAVIDCETGALTRIAEEIEPGDSIAATRRHVIVLAGSAQKSDAIVRVELTSAAVETLRT